MRSVFVGEQVAVEGGRVDGLCDREMLLLHIGT